MVRENDRLLHAGFSGAASVLLFIAFVSSSAFGAARPDLVAKVMSGGLVEARASWWGYDAEDSTRCLQDAINSRVPVLVVDKQKSPWTVMPIKGVSNQTLIFERGVEVVARKGEFLGKVDWLLTFKEAENVTLRGAGATLRMHRQDYRSAPYEQGEWRHALALLSCKNMTIEGLRICESGGDGIYVGEARCGLPCRNVTIRDCVIHDNYRQGVSVISADGLLIERTTLRDTAGTAPQAGIDFEPNKPSQMLRNCVLRDCVISGNAGANVDFFLANLNATSEPISVTIENCILVGSTLRVADSDKPDEKLPQGRILVDGCTIERCGGNAVSMINKRLKSFAIEMRRCRLLDNGVKSPKAADISFVNRSPMDAPADGIILDDVFIRQTAARPWFEKTSCRMRSANVEAVSGVVTVENPDGVTTQRLDAAWRKAFFGECEPTLSLPYVPFAANATPANAAVSDDAKGEMRGCAALCPRGCANYVFYAHSPGMVKFGGKTFFFMNGREFPRKFEVARMADGKTIAKGELPETGEFSVSVPAKGFYELRMRMNESRLAFSLLSADVPIALALPEFGQHFVSGGGRVSVFLPKGRRFAVFAGGQGSVEKVRIVVRDPSGKEMWRNGAVGEATGWGSSEDSPEGIWSIETGRPATGRLEDHFVGLRGIPALLFLTPGRHWTQEGDWH